MSQQEMYPQSQGQEQAHDSDVEIQAQPYYWSTQPKTTGDMPKNEHPSTFEDSIPPYSYPAQDSVQQPYTPPSEPYTEQFGQKLREEQPKSTGQQQGQAQKQQFSPDGDAFEYGYRPYRQPRSYQASPWARPQRSASNRKAFRWMILIGCAFFFYKPILFILAHLLTGIGILFGLAAFAILLPIIIILVLLGVFSVMALIVLSALGVPIRPGRMWGQWRRYNGRRRRWRW